MRILVVEDEERLAPTSNAACGYAVDIALNGDEGLYMASTNTYDALCLNLMLPELAGT